MYHMVSLLIVNDVQLFKTDQLPKVPLPKIIKYFQNIENLISFHLKLWPFL